MLAQQLRGSRAAGGAGEECLLVDLEALAALGEGDAGGRLALADVRHVETHRDLHLLVEKTERDGVLARVVVAEARTGAGRDEAHLL